MHKVLVQYVPMGVALAQPVENRMQYLDYTTPAPHQPCMEMIRIKVVIQAGSLRCTTFLMFWFWVIFIFSILGINN